MHTVLLSTLEPQWVRSAPSCADPVGANMISLRLNVGRQNK
jgi:hypothetical protein